MGFDPRTAEREGEWRKREEERLRGEEAVPRDEVIGVTNKLVDRMQGKDEDGFGTEAEAGLFELAPGRLLETLIYSVWATNIVLLAIGVLLAVKL